MLAVLGMTLALATPLQGQPVPQPFPRPGAPTVQAPPSRPTQPSSSPSVPVPEASPRAATDAAPTEAMLGVPIYPGAQFLTSYDAGRDQRYYLFGSASS